MLLAIPEREREAPSEALERTDAILLVEVEDHLAAASGFELMSGGDELQAELGRVGGLAVGDEPERATLVPERLQDSLRTWPSPAAMGERDRGVVRDREPSLQRCASAESITHDPNRRGQLVPSEDSPAARCQQSPPFNPPHHRQPCSNALFAAGVAILRQMPRLAGSIADYMPSSPFRGSYSMQNRQQRQAFRGLRRCAVERTISELTRRVENGIGIAPRAAGRGHFPSHDAPSPPPDPRFCHGRA